MSTDTRVATPGTAVRVVVGFDYDAYEMAIEEHAVGSRSARRQLESLVANLASDGAHPVDWNFVPEREARGEVVAELADLVVSEHPPIGRDAHVGCPGHREVVLAGEPWAPEPFVAVSFCVDPFANGHQTRGMARRERLNEDWLGARRGEPSAELACQQRQLASEAATVPITVPELTWRELEAAVTGVARIGDDGADWDKHARRVRALFDEELRACLPEQWRVQHGGVEDFAGLVVLVPPCTLDTREFVRPEIKAAVALRQESSHDEASRHHVDLALVAAWRAVELRWRDGGDASYVMVAPELLEATKGAFRDVARATEPEAVLRAEAGVRANLIAERVVREEQQRAVDQAGAVAEHRCHYRPGYEPSPYGVVVQARG